MRGSVMDVAVDAHDQFQVANPGRCDGRDSGRRYRRSSGWSARRCRRLSDRRCRRLSDRRCRGRSDRRYRGRSDRRCRGRSGARCGHRGRLRGQLLPWPARRPGDRQAARLAAHGAVDQHRPAAQARQASAGDRSGRRGRLEGSHDGVLGPRHRLAAPAAEPRVGWVGFVDVGIRVGGHGLSPRWSSSWRWSPSSAHP
jgi:hypothetical protein